MDLFENKAIGPMLFSRQADPFDDPQYIYELKLDGERCLAYLSSGGTELYNKRHKLITPRLPELADIHRQIKTKCILDGELIVLKHGVPDFYEIFRRTLATNALRIASLSRQLPAAFVAFDILYTNGRRVTDYPLTTRKKLLQHALSEETEHLALSRHIEERGIALFGLAKTKNLEGVVAKKKDSLYKIGARTDEWIKFKNIQDDDFVVCGYVESKDSPHVVSVILGLYQNDRLARQGLVLLGRARSEFTFIAKQRQTACPFDNAEQNAVYIAPDLVCTVAHIGRTAAGGLRHPVFKGLRLDKEPMECAASF